MIELAIDGAVPRGARSRSATGRRARSERRASWASARSSPRPPRSSRSATRSPGSIAEAQAAYAEASALVAAMSDEELSARVDAAAYLCSAATYLDRYDEAVAHAERALRLGRAAGHLHPTLLPALGAAHFMRGRLGEAADGARRRRRGGAAGRHHPEHGVDAAQPRAAVGAGRRPPGGARAWPRRRSSSRDGSTRASCRHGRRWRSRGRR